MMHEYRAGNLQLNKSHHRQHIWRCVLGQGENRQTESRHCRLVNNENYYTVSEWIWWPRDDGQKVENIAQPYKPTAGSTVMQLCEKAWRRSWTDWLLHSCWVLDNSGRQSHMLLTQRCEQKERSQSILIITITWKKSWLYSDQWVKLILF